MHSHAVLLLFVILTRILNGSPLGDDNETVFPVGANLQVDLMKRNSSELAKTSLTEPSIAVLSGDAPMPSESGIVGELVPFSPIDGCGPLEFNPLFHVANSTGGIEFQSYTNSTNFVVLMRRGSCSFAKMLENAAKVPHVVGVLLFDPNSVGLTLSLSVSSDKPLIPAIYISKTLGEDLLKKTTKYRELAASSSGTADDNPWVQVTMRYIPVKVNMTKALQIFLIIIVVTLVLTLILSMAWNHRLRTQQQQGSGEEAPQPPPRRRPEEIPIDEEFLAKIPRRSYRSPNTSPMDLKPGPMMEYTPGHDDDDDYRQRVPHNETCPVCIEEFVYGAEICQLHCGHCYHPVCIIPWLQARSPLCPLCNIDVRVSMIEAEELAFVRSLRRLQRAKSTTAAEVGLNTALIKKMTINSADGTEMKEVCVVSAAATSINSGRSSVRARNASFDSIPLEAAPHSRTRSSA